MYKQGRGINREIKAKQMCQTKGQYIKDNSLKSIFNRCFKNWNGCSNQSLRQTDQDCVIIRPKCYSVHRLLKVFYATGSQKRQKRDRWGLLNSIEIVDVLGVMLFKTWIDACCI